MLAVLTGYDGDHPPSFAPAVSSKSAGNYTLRFSDHATLGHLTVFADQHVTIVGEDAPVGQLALLVASVHVLDRGSVWLQSLHLGGRATVDSGGVMATPGSLHCSCCSSNGISMLQSLLLHLG